jgi:predicted ABC-type transport system involved in lysophospholipase L1 biosynthesis ATPase subunit
VLADEPTGNLDEEMAAKVSDLLADLVGGERRTLLVVTHSRVLASRMDRVLRLDHGRLVEEGRA